MGMLSRRRSAPDQATARSTNPRRRVLIVDDSPTVCHMLEALIRRIRTADVQVVICTRAREAIDTLCAEQFDVTVSDFLLGDIDGLDVLAAARAKNPSGLRILLTAVNEIPVPLARIQDAGVDSYIRKPLELHEILLLLIAFLHKDESTLMEHRTHARELESLAAHQANVHATRLASVES